MRRREESVRMCAQSQRREANPPQRFSGSDHSASVEILLIGRIPVMPMYTDEVLRQAGFRVRAITPGEAAEVVKESAAAYPLVVFSDTLSANDISELGVQLRRRSPASKMLLMLGPDSTLQNDSIFDATMEGLDGPAALIREVRRLADSSPRRVPSGDDVVRSV